LPSGVNATTLIATHRRILAEAPQGGLQSD
jgi:hypothetical protein